MPVSTQIQKELFHATRDGDLERFRNALENGANPSITGRGIDYGIGRQEVGVLHVAARYGHLEILARLLEMGVDIDAQIVNRDFDSIFEREVGGLQETALCLAATGGYIEMVKFLLDRGADPNLYGALHCATRSGNLDLVRRLVDSGADIHQELDSRSLMYFAASWGQAEILAWLHDRGCRFRPYQELSIVRKTARKNRHDEVLAWLSAHRDQELVSP